MRDYHLACTLCGAVYQDDGALLECSHAHSSALLRSVYSTRSLNVGTASSMLRYDSWLPNGRYVETTARTAVYRSTGLASHLGLRQLWIAFNGWWPARGATLPTGSFKDLEAVSVARRLSPADTRTLVVSSAGNTALAFARVCTDNDIPVLIIVPLRAWHDVMSSARIGSSVRVVAIADAGYEEATVFARELCASAEFMLEGGVRNVGRRDGMGTAMLAAVEAIGKLPQFYFQAVGSAAGALAAYEAALRVIVDGRFGTELPRLMLSQNAPFTPIHDAWLANSPTLVERFAAVTEEELASIGAFVLSNQTPPYAVAGGIREALAATNGRTYAITNEQLRNAMSLFAELEGVSIEPAAGVAVASLAQAVRTADVARDDAVLLHITGGGRDTLQNDRALRGQPSLVLARAELHSTAIDRARLLARS